MPLCTKCGTSNPDDVRFCPECGNLSEELIIPAPDVPPAAVPVAAIPEAPVMQPPVQPDVPVMQPPVQPDAPPPIPPPAPPPVYILPTPVSAPLPTPQPVLSRNAPPPKGSPYRMVSTAAFVGWMILFALPVVGWIICIIMAFVPGKRNRQNFARAQIVLALIGIAVFILLYFVVRFWLDSFFGGVFSFFPDFTGDLFSGLDIPFGS